MLNYTNIELVRTAGLSEQIPRDGIPQIALSGRSNVGKSSFLNKISNRKSLARVSGSPEKTITLNFYLVDKKLYIVDLPGYGFAKRAPADREKWSRLTDGYLTGGLPVGVAQLIDLKVGPTADDEMMLDFLGQTAMPFIVIATKADKLSKAQRGRSIPVICRTLVVQPWEIITYSSEDGTGRDALLALIDGIVFPKIDENTEE